MTIHSNTPDKRRLPDVAFGGDDVVVFALMQTYHTWLHWHEFSNIRHALNQYYDGEEKLQLLNAHPEWSNEAVARECGFTDRSYFQRKFKELTGRTPAEWRESTNIK